MTQSERQDLNLRPPLPQSGALPSCATPRTGILGGDLLGFGLELAWLEAPFDGLI